MSKTTANGNGNGHTTTNRINAIGGTSPTNGAADAIAYCEPYTATVGIQGTADLLFHRWNTEAVAEKASAAKGSKSKKSDNVESYVYRNEEGELCMPTEYLRMAIVGAAKFKQDPRSPRKSAMDLFKAAIIPVTGDVSLGKKEWDYLDCRRVVIQRNAISRSRPALKAGWRAEFRFEIGIPEYIDPMLLHDVLSTAGRLIGVGDFRPTFGRFAVVKFETSQS